MCGHRSKNEQAVGLRAASRWFACAWRMLLVAAAIYGSAVSTAAAHAVLLATEPADGATLTASPVEIVLLFNEPVVPVTVRAIAASGEPVVAAGTVHAVDKQIRLSLPSDLSPGGYLVSYRVVSADSHPIGGSFVFYVGTAAAPIVASPNDASREEIWQVVKLLLRFLQDAALMIAAGGALFRWLVVGTRQPVPGLEVAIRFGAAVAVLAALPSIAVQGLLAAAAPASAFLAAETWRLGLSSTVGTTVLVLIPALGVVALGTIAAWGVIGRVAGALGGLAACASLALSGHGAAMGAGAQTMLALHAMTAAYWLGSLAPLLRIVRTRSAGDAAVLVRRFSNIAIPTVLFLLATGLGTALTRLDEPAALTGSDYGRLLLLKLAFVALLLATAAVNRWRWTPAVASGKRDGAAALARNIRLELALGCALLLVTAVLAHTPPPHRMDDHADHDHGAPAHGAVDHVNGYSVAALSSQRMLLLEVTPARVGANALRLRLAQGGGHPAPAMEVSVALSLATAGIEPLVRKPVRRADGHYELPRVDLPVAGNWSIRVDVLVSDFEKTTFTVEVPVR